jgi:hypothetical protein
VGKRIGFDLIRMHRITECVVVAKARSVSVTESAPPYSVVRGSSVLMGESFLRRQQPKLIVFMSPQRELGGCTVTCRQPRTSQRVRLLLDTVEWNSVLFVNPPTSVGGSKLAFWYCCVNLFSVNKIENQSYS